MSSFGACGNGRSYRSAQGELLAIIEEAVRPEHELSPAELLREVRRLGLRASADSANIIRADRDRIRPLLVG